MSAVLAVLIHIFLSYSYQEYHNRYERLLTGSTLENKQENKTHPRFIGDDKVDTGKKVGEKKELSTLSVDSQNRYESSVETLSEGDDLNKFAIPWFSHPDLPRPITKKEYHRVLELVRHIDEAFRENNVTYMLAFGTLLGAYVNHGILPWDDDLDLTASVSDYEKILHMFGNGTKYPQLTTFDFKKGGPNKVKIYFAEDPNAGGYAWKWPFADISFLLLNTTHAWFTTEKHLYLIPEDVYPLHSRPFGNMWLPVPHNPGKIQQEKYKTFKCMSHFWDHKRETVTAVVSVRCRSLMEVYPFVERSSEETGVIRETLVLNGSSIYSLRMNEPYHNFGIV